MGGVADYFDVEGAAQELRRLARQIGAADFARVRNLDYRLAPAALYPLAPHNRPPLERIAAFAMDMDGTSTTTEPLALHALEYMVRRITGRLTHAAWPGLDPKLDYPHVVGNSNLRHTEFLVERYREHLDPPAFRQAFIEAACWTLASMDDVQRRQDVTHNARVCGLGNLLDDDDFKRLVAGGDVAAERLAVEVEPLVRRHGPSFRCDHAGQLVAAALDIYYTRYHSILKSIQAGRGAELSGQLLGDAGRRLIEPMPGYEIFVPLVKGWMGREIETLYEVLRGAIRPGAFADREGDTPDTGRARLVRLAEHFRKQPAKLALVTASISFEACVTMTEVMAVARERIGAWPIAAEQRQRIAARMADFRGVFDAFVNASDACEHRLKPHPDLYSLALRQMSIPKGEYAQCVGLEDTEPGIVALRAAGIGCAVALPNRDTSAQDYSAATRTVGGGLPGLILVHNLLLADAT